jgi:hypothetical protein
VKFHFKRIAGDEAKKRGPPGQVLTETHQAFGDQTGEGGVNGRIGYIFTSLSQVGGGCLKAGLCFVKILLMNGSVGQQALGPLKAQIGQAMGRISLFHGRDQATCLQFKEELAFFHPGPLLEVNGDQRAVHLCDQGDIVLRPQGSHQIEPLLHGTLHHLGHHHRNGEASRPDSLWFGTGTAQKQTSTNQ